MKKSIFALRYNAYLSPGMPQVSVGQHESIIRALEKGDLEKLKLSVKENIIYPKVIHESRKTKPSNAIAKV